MLFLVNFKLKTTIGLTALMWLISDICVLIMSLLMLIKNKLPNKKQILISLLFGVLIFIAYKGITISSVKVFLVMFLSSLACFSIFNRYKNNALIFLKKDNLKSVLLSIIIGLITGIVLGIVNLFLNNGTPNLRITLTCFLTALSPAIYEEIAFRTFMFALCIYFLKGDLNTKIEKFTCYFMMIIPHVMIHTPEQFVKYGLISGIISIFILALLFGLPFAFLQKKHDITSAMIAHGVVDIIRFCFLGLPF
ncbi:CPBP family glutamic-type intramembrane protease [Clostridium sediminicola]|uniref:CPBP family glutamic-type intramembrane protease n=1 Tax=Clostridium sediminicola TaxID=3114879 RepID=UPI003D169CA1